MKRRWLLLLCGILLVGVVQADEPATETTAGWIKHPQNPVLGGALGTCFDVSVLRDGGHYRMWFSWRPKKSIALVESPDGVQWTKPVIGLGPNAQTDWEQDVNRPVVLKHGDRYHIKKGEVYQQDVKHWRAIPQVMKPLARREVSSRGFEEVPPVGRLSAAGVNPGRCHADSPRA